MKKKIVIIGAGCFQKALIEKAKEMGVETHVFAWEEGAVGKGAADFFYPVSIREKEKILKQCKRIRPDGAVTIASELANITVSYLTEKLGLPGNCDRCVEMTTNKARMRKRMQEAGLSGPDFCVVSREMAKNFRPVFPFPVVVKPTDRSGSRGVKRVDSQKQLRRAMEDAFSCSFEKKVIVEEWIEGKEYSCECLSWQGKHYCLAITEKYTTGAPEYVETGHLEPALLPDADKVRQEVFRVLDILEVKNGASHTEFKIDDSGRIRMIEVGSRMGGDCIGSDLVPLATGVDYVADVIRIALGKPPVMAKGTCYGAAAVKFFLTETDKKLPEKVKADPQLSLISHCNEECGGGPVLDSTQRGGYFIFAGESYDAVRKIMEDPR